ncbi:DNA replication and repair protein RecF [Candidatus Saccharibacteria bacterium]|nr:DNA replication and repair protein RecF [Candidatus Saccharibacteria bacterium]
MIIQEITLTNFRNHEQYHLICDPDTTLIIGENGFGKTSILEAIYILTRGKSFRATDPDIIKHNTDYYRIELKYNNGEKIIATYDNKNKTFLITDKKSRRLPKKNKYPVVLFQPSDLNLISGSPSRRRDYFDRFFGQLTESYSNALARYNKALHQRNELLKSDYFSPSNLFSWNVLLAKYGTIISEIRRQAINEINQQINDIYYSIAENSDQVELIYHTDVLHNQESEYLRQLEDNIEKDHIIGHTSYGIHRDDIGFEFNHKKADGSASRGETRSIILALKFTEANTIYDKLQQKPIVLLDDVFSELDEYRRKCLVKNFKDHQVIITSVEKI